MNLEQAKTQLRHFLRGRVLTFSITPYPNGEWVAECNEVPAIITGGLGGDITTMDCMMRDAILTAAGVDTQYAGEALEFIGYKPVGVLAQIFGSENKKAEYAIP